MCEKNESRLSMGFSRQKSPEVPMDKRLLEFATSTNPLRDQISRAVESEHARVKKWQSD
jgi:hypothetical protein